MAEKSNHNKPAKLQRHRRLRIGGYAVLLTVLFIGIIVLINIGVEAVEDNWALRLDLSYNSLTKLSDQTKSALATLEEDVTFYVLAADGAEDARMMEVLDRYRAASDHVKVRVIDPETNPGITNKFRSTEATSFGSNTVIVTNAAETRYKVYTYYELLDIAYNQSTQQQYVRGFQYEKMFTQGMLFATAEKTPTVYILQGHGEVAMANLTAMQQLLTDNNYDVVELGITDEIPAGNTDILFVLSPQKDLTAEERSKIAAYLENGGNMLYACDVTAPNNLKNFNSLLTYYGVAFADGMVVADPTDTRQYYQYTSYLIPALAKTDVIMNPLIDADQGSILLTQTRAIALPAMDRGDFTVTPLLASLGGSYLIDITDTSRESAERQEGDIEGPFSLAAAVQHLNYADADKESRIVVLGSSLTITEQQLLNSFNNGEFLLSAVKWATKDEAINLSIVSKTNMRAQLNITSTAQRNMLGVIVVIGMPLVVLLCGIVVWLRRRHL